LVSRLFTVLPIFGISIHSTLASLKRHGSLKCASHGASKLVLYEFYSFSFTRTCVCRVNITTYTAIGFTSIPSTLI
jgi:hypothetical protein